MQTKSSSLGQLTAGIAHEIKNPLNFVNNFSGVSVELIDELQEALSDAGLDEKRRAEIGELAQTLRDNLDKIVQHGKRADAIVKNMLLHSREGSGEQRPVDINALVAESLDLCLSRCPSEAELYHHPGAVELQQEFERNIAELDDLIGEILTASRLDALDRLHDLSEVDLLAIAAENSGQGRCDN